MFTRLLDSARDEAKKEVATPISSSKKNSIDFIAEAHNLSNNLSNEELCELFAEFLFDIFDANCMDEFKQIEALELRQCNLFSSWSKGNEFTLTQGDAHNEFCTLFESLCSEFLLQNNVTQNKLFAAAESALKEDVGKEKMSDNSWDNQSAGDQANEIWDVVRSVQDIEVWAEQMKETYERNNRK